MNDGEITITITIKSAAKMLQAGGTSDLGPQSPRKICAAALTGVSKFCAGFR
jgi:hypothetical protein